MKLLLTILVLTAPLVLALRTRRASPTASALNDARPTLYASPSTITPRPTTPTTRKPVPSNHFVETRTTSTAPVPRTTLDTTTQAPMFVSYVPRIRKIDKITTPAPTPRFLPSLGPRPTPPTPLSALYFPPVTNNTSSPAPSITQAPVYYSYRSRIKPADLKSTKKNFQPLPPQNPQAFIPLETPHERSTPITTGSSEGSSPLPIQYFTPTTRSPPPPSYLRQITNTTPGPTQYTPSSLLPRNVQPDTTPAPPARTTGPATYRPPFHDACTPIGSTSETNPIRGGHVLCVLNIVNYYGQVHYHQVHNHYYAPANST